MMTLNELKATVMYLLRTAAEAKYEGLRADYVNEVEVTRHSRTQRGWEDRYEALVAEREPQVAAAYAKGAADYEQAVRDEMRREWKNLKATGMRRLQRASRSRHLPADLRKWAARQLVSAVKHRNPWTVAYAVLVLRDAAEWEMMHDEDTSLDAMVTASFGDARE